MDGPTVTGNIKKVEDYLAAGGSPADDQQRPTVGASKSSNSSGSGSDWGNSWGDWGDWGNGEWGNGASSSSAPAPSPSASSSVRPDWCDPVKNVCWGGNGRRKNVVRIRSLEKFTKYFCVYDS